MGSCGLSEGGNILQRHKSLSVLKPLVPHGQISQQACYHIGNKCYLPEQIFPDPK